MMIRTSPHPMACVSLWPLSLLDLREVAEVDRAARARNLSECETGRAGCGYSLLSPSQAAALATADDLRDDTACREGRGDCDRSRLTPAQAAAIPEPPGVASSVGSQP
jgi:hypothetical protein